MDNAAATALPPTGPVAKQAVILIHGMGEQIAMDTIKGFVETAWELDTAITANGLPNPAKVWSKPDDRTSSLELRRVTTRESIGCNSFPNGVRTDFYELYWADLTAGSTKVNHPCTNGQVKRMNRTIKDATVKRFYYETHEQLQQHLRQFIDAYNFARRLKTLKGFTPYEFICQPWQKEAGGFTLDPLHQMLGLNT